jgi:hypothetical protein
MSDDQKGTPRPDDETQPVRAEGLPPAPATNDAPKDEPNDAPSAATHAPADPVAPAPAARRGFGERFRGLRRSDGSRAFGLAALIASALAGIIVGGLGFAAVHAIADDGGRDRGGWLQQRDADDRGPGRGGMHGGPRGVPGQLPPTTPPDDDDSSTS